MSDSVQPHRWQPIRLRCPWDSPGKNTGVGCHFLLQCRKVKSEREVAQSCPTLSNPMDCSLPGSSVHGIFQARELEWGAIAFSNTSQLIGLIAFLRRYPDFDFCGVCVASTVSGYSCCNCFFSVTIGYRSVQRCPSESPGLQSHFSQLCCVGQPWSLTVMEEGCPGSMVMLPSPYSLAYWAQSIQMVIWASGSVEPTLYLWETSSPLLPQARV